MCVPCFPCSVIPSNLALKSNFVNIHLCPEPYVKLQPLIEVLSMTFYSEFPEEVQIDSVWGLGFLHLRVLGLCRKMKVIAKCWLHNAAIVGFRTGG